MRLTTFLAIAVLAGACEEIGGEGGGGEGGEGGGGLDTGGGGGSCSTGQLASAEEGPTMQPGGDCISCHAAGEGPNFTLAGTVMNDYGDSIGCSGVQGVAVNVTDANGKLHRLTTNAVGNFYTTEAIPGPYAIELEYQGLTRAMGAQQSTGDCMTCHTANGQNGAPGRIIAP